VSKLGNAVRLGVEAVLDTEKGSPMKLRVFESISVDGFFADRQGDIAWARSGRQDPEFGAWVASNASGAGILLFGRVTYQMMEAFWPTPAATAQMPQVARGMNAARKLVASRTIKPTWTNTERIEGDLIEAVRVLKDQDGRGITVLGSGSVAAQLGEAGLVDEYQFVVLPLALGGGRPVFRKGTSLHLVEHRAFRCGNLVLTYARPQG
jgi:dihydrofolate reductase